MRKYELLLVLPGTLDEKEAESRSQEILNLVKENSEEAEISTMGKNRLAYPIKQIRYGYFYTIVFKATPEKLKVLEDKTGLMRDVLRAMYSHFNTQLTAQQKIAYTTDASGVTVMRPREEAPAAVGAVAVEELPVKKVEEKPAEKLDMADINKKLDEIMGGDVIPGV